MFAESESKDWISRKAATPARIRRISTPDPRAVLAKTTSPIRRFPWDAGAAVDESVVLM
ncbi:hypothetical protein GCM10009605_53100 [Nocardiopsis composta]